jgi:hypothetical protein
MSAARPELFFVFNVKAVGVYGEAFAYGAVAIDRQGQRLGAHGGWCPPERAAGTDEGRRWVAKNWRPPPYLPASLAERNPARLRENFWESWLWWKSKGALMAADRVWPVAVRFMAACINDGPYGSGLWGSPLPEFANGLGPYPLLDVSALRLAVGLDPPGTEERLPDELPVHDARADARHSARLLVEALAWTGMVGESVLSI